MTTERYGNLARLQIMAGITVNDSMSSADAELTMYLGTACDFIDDSLKEVAFKLKDFLFKKRVK